MYFWNIFRGKILLLSYMVFHSLAYNANDKLCDRTQLILLPKEIYKKCNVILSKKDVQKAPTVKVPANSNLISQNYMLLMIDTDEFPHSAMAYPYWIKTHITLKELESGVTAGPEDVVPLKPTHQDAGMHHYQFLLYPQKLDSVVLNGQMAMTRLLDVQKFETKNNVMPIMSFQYLISVERRASTASDLINQRISCLFMIILIYFNQLLS